MFNIPQIAAENYVVVLRLWRVCDRMFFWVAGPPWKNQKFDNHDRSDG